MNLSIKLYVIHKLIVYANKIVIICDYNMYQGINLSNKLLSDHILNCEMHIQKKLMLYDTRVDLGLPERGTVIDLYEAGV